MEPTATKVKRKSGPKGPSRWTPKAIAAEGRALLAWMKADENQFWLGSFAHQRGYSDRRMREWANPENKCYSEEFSECYQITKEIQESRLIKMGLKMRNPRLVIWMLRLHHGYDRWNYGCQPDPDPPPRPAASMTAEEIEHKYMPLLQKAVAQRQKAMSNGLS